jgi:hypothetical protein
LLNQGSGQVIKIHKVRDRGSPISFILSFSSESTCTYVQSPILAMSATQEAADFGRSHRASAVLYFDDNSGRLKSEAVF